MATQSTLEQVQVIYIGLLGRAADLEGLNYWAGEITDGKITIEQVRANIVNEQPEYVANLGAILSREVLVTTLYQNMFNRDAESDGLDYWLNGGGKTVNADQLVLALSNGASAIDELTLDNRVEVANFYSANAIFNIPTAVAVLLNVDSTLTSLKEAKASVILIGDNNSEFLLTSAYDAALIDYNIAITLADDTLIEAQNAKDAYDTAALAVSNVDEANAAIALATIATEAANAALTAATAQATAATALQTAATATTSNDDDLIASSAVRASSTASTAATSTVTSAISAANVAAAVLVELDPQTALNNAFDAALIDYNIATKLADDALIEAQNAKDAYDTAALAVNNLDDANAAIALATTSTTAANAALTAATAQATAATALQTAATATTSNDDDPIAINAVLSAQSATDTAANSVDSAIRAADEATTVLDNLASEISLTLVGTSVADTLIGGSGDDIITGGGGADTLTGGGGADIFAYAKSATELVTYIGTDATTANIEKITDFTAATDTIRLTSGATFSGLLLTDTTGFTVNEGSISPFAIAAGAASINILTALFEAAASGAVSTFGTAGTATGLQIYTFSTAAGAGAFDGRSFLVFNDATAAIAATDVIIDVTGVVGNIGVSNFAILAA